MVIQSGHALWRTVTVGLALALGLAACGSDSTTETAPANDANDATATSEGKDPILLGATFDLTGPTASPHGESGKRGLELAVAEINSAGGIAGRPLESVLEDHQYDTASSVAALQKLIDRDKVVVFLTYGSAVVQAQAPIFERSGVLAIDPFSSSPELAKVSRDTGLYFQTANPSGVEAQPLAKAAYDSGIREIATLVWNNERGLGAGKAFEEAFVEVGGSVLGTVTSEPDATDYRAELTRLKSLGADGVFVSSTSGVAAAQVAQAEQIGIETTWLCDWNTCTSEFFESIGSAASGTLVSGFFDPEAGAEESRELAEKIREEFGETATYYDASVYDAVHLFADAARKVLESGNELSGENLASALLDVEGYPGASGPISFNEVGTMEPQPVIVWRVDSDGKLEEVD